MSWKTYAFECVDESQRESLMAWFEANHPVEFPANRYSVFESVVGDDGAETGADYAWLGRYLYVTVMGEADDIVWHSADRWERAAIAEFDNHTETVVDGLFVMDTDSGAEDEAKVHPLQGPPEWAGNGVMYALAVKRQFRFRAYAAQSPTHQVTPHPDAFTVPTAFAEDFDGFIEEIAEATGIEPTEEGLAFLRDDPADDDRYVYGETYGPTDD